jgi:thymidylate synthase ThyX
MRVLNVSQGMGWDYATGPTVEANAWSKDIYRNSMDHAAKSYKALIQAGVAVEDARGVLPTNILTNIVMKLNMRTFIELVRKRSSPRVQGEYRIVLEQMKISVRGVHPWIDLFINRTFEQAAKDLDAKIKELVPADKQMELHKLVDQLRTQS